MSGGSFDPSKHDIPLSREEFLLSLIRGLAGELEQLVSLPEASGFVSLVGQTVGDRINDDYRKAAGKQTFSLHEVAAVLVDLKRRINGDFYIVEVNEDRIVLGNRSCPFGDRVNGRESLCMMTSNVFGTIAADHLGYARIEIPEAIARGDKGCRVIIHLKPPAANTPVDGQEFFGNDAG